MLDHLQHNRDIRDNNAKLPMSTRYVLRPVHWIIVNTILAGLLMLLAPNPSITIIVGGSAIGLAAFTGANVARNRMADMATPTLLDILAAWLPGLAALALAIVGLALVLQANGNALLQFCGIALFLIQILFIAVLGAATEQVDRPAQREPAGHSV